MTKLALMRMVERGLADLKANRTISNEEMQRKIKLITSLDIIPI